jgi:hypothetical protein
MKGWQAYRKVNYVHNVKVNVCGAGDSDGVTEGQISTIMLNNAMRIAHKALDNVLSVGIIILTDGGLQTRDGGPVWSKYSESIMPGGVRR